MKARYIIIPLVIIILVVAGYFAYNFFQGSSKYQLTLQSQLNPSDYHTPGTQVKEIAETYTYNGNWYHASVMEFADTNTATQGISKLKETYNPGMIILDKKYVNYVDLGNKYNFYFYQSGKYILVLDMTGEKDLADSFVIWYYSKYSNQ